MRAVICLSVFLTGVLCQDVNQMANMPKYDSRYDYLDVDAIFTNKRLVIAYVDCLINSHRCTPEGKALKRLLPEALRTKCIRCTERQKRTAVKIITRLKYEYPEEWDKLSARWDPTGDFTKYFEEFLAKEHFNSIPGSGNVIPLSVGNQPPRPSPPPPPVLTQRPMPVPEPEPVAPAQVPVTQPPVMLSTPPRPAIMNRFGGDGELMVGSPSSAAGTTRPQSPVAPTMGMAITPPAMQPKPVPITLAPSTVLPTPYSTAITFIDQIGYKIIRTTELVTDILRNTVRAVVG